MLTKRQKDILNIIKDNPEFTLEEIAQTLNLSSVSNVHMHIKNLTDKGYIKRNGRSLVVKDMGDSPIVYIPYYGEAQCGYNDIISEENVLDYVPMPRRFLPSGTLDNIFLIKAVGDSMEPIIQEDDLILFKKVEDGYMPGLNEIVLCSLDGALKVKKFSIMQNTGYLISENKERYNPIPFDESNYIRICGKMIKMKS